MRTGIYQRNHPERPHPGWDDTREGDPCVRCGVPRHAAHDRPCETALERQIRQEPDGSKEKR